MLRFILFRLAQLPLILAAVVLIALTLAWAIPGNPLDGPEGRRPPPEVQQAMKARYKLDDFWSFARSYAGSVSGATYVRDAANGALRREREAAMLAGAAPPTRVLFDFGPSLQYRDRKVGEIIASALPVSMMLGAAAVAIALVLGVGLGVLSAARRGGFIDGASFVLALVGVSVPSFVTGTLLLMVFAAWLGWFRVGVWDPPMSLVLPALTLSLPFAAYIARLTRMGMVEALASDYARAARARGISERDVLFRHALPNAFLPVLSYLGPATAFAMTGSFVVESIFSVPGMGQHFVNAVLNKDLFLILGVVIVFSALLVLLNLAVDVLTRWVDPRAA